MIPLGKLCAARQSRPVDIDLGVMPQRVGTKGLRGKRVAMRNRRPRQEMFGRRSLAPANCLAGSDAARGGCSEEQLPLAAD